MKANAKYGEHDELMQTRARVNRKQKKYINQIHWALQLQKICKLIIH